MENILIDYDALWNNGMGLHKIQFDEILNILKKKKIKTVVEFGSGGSTQFLCLTRSHLNLDFNITSFDHSKDFSFKGDFPFLDLKIRNLNKCSDDDFNRCFANSVYPIGDFHDCQNEENNFRVRNAFYNIDKNDLPENIDLVILDGPNGNGRSLAFPLIKEKISDECWVMIDDSDHYDFVERCKETFETEVIKSVKDQEIHQLFSYCLVKIKKK